MNWFVVANVGLTGQTNDSGSPSPNIVVRLDWDGPFHLPINQNFRKFWHNGKDQITLPLEINLGCCHPMCLHFILQRQAALVLVNRMTFFHCFFWLFYRLEYDFLGHRLHLKVLFFLIKCLLSVTYRTHATFSCSRTAVKPKQILAIVSTSFLALHFRYLHLLWVSISLLDCLSLFFVIARSD